MANANLICAMPLSRRGLTITCRRRRRRAGNRAVLPGAEPALKSFGAFPEHPQKCLRLSFVQLVSETVEQLCFVD
jgi:hypothetical protein